MWLESGSSVLMEPWGQRPALHPVLPSGCAGCVRRPGQAPLQCVHLGTTARGALVFPLGLGLTCIAHPPAARLPPARGCLVMVKCARSTSFQGDAQLGVQQTGASVPQVTAVAADALPGGVTAVMPWPPGQDSGGPCKRQPHHCGSLLVAARPSSWPPHPLLWRSGRLGAALGTTWGLVLLPGLHEGVVTHDKRCPAAWGNVHTPGGQGSPCPLL